MTIAHVDRASTGIAGLDEVLHGGLIRRRTYLISGPPGSGKTTLGFHFLADGLAAGEAVLFISFGEAETTLRANAAASGFDVGDVHFVDLSPSSDIFTSVASYDIFSPSEVDREPTMRSIVEAVHRVHPKRVFIDSMTHLRYLATDHFAFRRQSLSFLRFLRDSGADVVITSESTSESPDDDLRFLVDGVIEIANGVRARTLAISKFRGSAFRPGRHALRLDGGGATVYPRLVPESHRKAFDAAALSTGLERLDEMLHGGIERGTITLLTGPSGVGKTTIGAQIVKEAASRGERSAVYTFDEGLATLVGRCESINIPIRDLMATGKLEVFEVEALRFGPDEFANVVRRDVEANGTSVVLIDSVSGYRVSVAGEDLVERLHALCKYLKNVGVTVILVNELADLSHFRISDIGISYLADNVIFMRYVEEQNGSRAHLRRAVGILKKRLSDFDKSLRQFSFSSAGITIGDYLPNLGGILHSLYRDDRRTD